jgi:1,4-alpha-glucan branching enzyme
MKIALVTSFFEPIGGQENVTRCLFNELANAGHDVTVITIHNEWEDPNGKIRLLEPLNNIPHKVLIPGSPAIDGLIAIRLTAALKKLNPQLIHVQDEFVLPATVIANRRLKFPIICSCHNNLFSYTGKTESTRERITNFLFRTRKYNYISRLKEVDAIISVSDYIKKELISVGIDKRKIQTIYNVHFLTPPKRTNSEPPYQSNIILFSLGRLVWYKGFDVLIKAFRIAVKKEPSIKLIIAGNGPELWHLRGLVTAYQLEHYVHLTGRVSDELVQRFYSDSDIVVLPSIYPDPAPIVTMEAMSFKKPIIASRIGGIPEIVIDNVNGLIVPPDDPQKLAEAILVLARNKQLRETMGQAGSRLLVEKFGNETLINQTIELYKRIIGESPDKQEIGPVTIPHPKQIANVC